MKIKFNQQIELKVITGITQWDEPIIETEKFDLGDITEVELIETNDEFKTATIQFGEGSVAYGVPRGCFNEVN